MVDLHTLVTFCAVVLGLFLIPGPAVLLTLGRAVSGGRVLGLATGWGISTGDLLHALAATLGLSAILLTSATAFSAVKFAGVAYLMYLGIKALLEKSGALSLAAQPQVTVVRAYTQGILTEVLNPKTALFFLAFLPQFVHIERGHVTVQLLTLGLTFVAMSALYTALIALAGGRVARLLKRYPIVGQYSGKVVGSIYLLLGLRMALEGRG